MKSRFSTIDIKATLAKIRQSLLGMRVANVYDIDNKTYLIKLAKPDHKAVILMESGIRIHSTEFEWPKNMTPSGFSMKLRKHLRTRRLEKIEQLGIDRVVDMQFGSGEAAYHVILELYDRGNLVLTDHEYTILNILRPRTDQSQDVKLAVREKYPVELAKQPEGPISSERLTAIMLSGKEGDPLKKILNPHLVYGPALLDHVLLTAGFPENAKMGKDFSMADDMSRLLSALHEAEMMLQSTESGTCKGYLIQKREKKATVQAGESDELLTYQEFHPFHFRQHEKLPFVEFDSFDTAADNFFSNIGAQKLDLKVVQQEKAALKKLENVKKDHEKRLDALKRDQEADKRKAELIEMNLPLVDRAIMIVQSAVANQIDWTEIQNIVKEAQMQGDAVASSITGLKLDSNQITMLLKNPYDYCDDDEDDDDKIKPMKVDIDLGLSAYANARKHYDMKRHAAKKEQKTVDASEKAFKSAEKKTKETLKEVATVASINKARKTYWFEKFLWFISSENYLVIGGRDQQQNEFIVKRHMRPGDIYVHADLHGASSCIIKNPSGEPVPPKTLNEAGTMAVCNSAAWDAKVVTSAWWVYHHQVSKTAPTGEYLTTGSFMVRGKKNFLPPSYLVFGFGFMFKLDEDSIFRHKDERKVRTFDDDASSVAESSTTSNDQELDISDGDSDSEHGEDPQHSEDKLDSIHKEEDSNEAQSERTENGQEQEIKRTPPQISKDVKDTNMDVDKIDDAEQNDEAEKGEEAAASESSDEGDSLFPDTSIQLQHVKGDKFTLQRNISSVSHTSTEPDEGEPFENKPGVTKATGRISAKQRREMKKKAKRTQAKEEGLDEELDEKDEILPEPQSQKSKKQQKQEQQQQQQPPLKRGQKNKMKKIKEKYKDQDEEERELRMQIIGSAGPQKESKKNKKDKKGSKQIQQEKHQKQQGKPKQIIRAGGQLTVADIKLETLTIDDKANIAQTAEGIVAKAEDDDEGAMSDEEKQAILEDENITKDASILDSMTGQPLSEDTLLFCVPVCAPYSTLTNYKYKVKLTPGTTKRGKATKTALHMYQSDRNITPREKELFKSVKDVDLSRNMPGKVKVSAPNLQKARKK